MRGKILVLLVFMSLLISSIGSVHSDFLFIPAKDEYLQNPAQIAIISWYNGEEVLVFGSNIKSSISITGLGVVPLPNKPHYIGLGSVGSLEKALDKFSSGIRVAGASGTVTVEFNVVLGPYNVTCIKIDPHTSMDEIGDILLEIASQNDLSSLSLRYSALSVLSDYVKNGFYYFLVYVVNAKNYASGFLPPLVVKFRTDYVWYPLVVSSLYANKLTFAKIVVISPLDDIDLKFEPNLSWSSRLVYSKKRVSRWDINDIDSRLLDIFPFYYLWFEAHIIDFVGYPVELQFDFIAELKGNNINIIFYTLASGIMLALIFMLFFMSRREAVETKLGRLFGFIEKLSTLPTSRPRAAFLIHIFCLIIFGALVFGGILFMPPAPDLEEAISAYLDLTPIFDLIYYTFNYLILIALTIIFSIIIYRTYGYWNSKNPELLIAHNSILKKTIATIVILMLLMGVTKFIEYLYARYGAVNFSEIMLVLILLVLVAEWLLRITKLKLQRHT